MGESVIRVNVTRVYLHIFVLRRVDIAIPFESAEQLE